MGKGKMSNRSRKRWPCFSGRQGFSYVEILVAIALIAACLIPALESLSPAMFGLREQEKLGANALAVRSKMEEVLAVPYGKLEEAALDAGGPQVASRFSEASYATGDGRHISLQVYLSSYDGDNADGDNDGFTGTDEGLLWVKVAVDGSPESLETLTSIYDYE